MATAMDAPDVIDSYVHDVARRLPHRQRDDVAYELKALLADDLRARGEREGRPVDRALAEELLQDVGRPAETAARYGRPFTIIEPSDTWAFVWAAVAGAHAATLIASKGPAGSGEAASDPTPAVLAWIGLLVVVFAAKNLIRRSRPEAFRWSPRPLRDADAVNHGGTVGLAALFTGLLVLYWAPGPLVEALTFGRVDAETLAYSDDFAGALRRPWLAGILAAAVVLHLLVTVRGRWTRALRWVQVIVLVHCAIQLGWHVRYGNVFQDAAADQLLFGWIDGAAAVFWLAASIAFYREWTRVRPAPTGGPPLHAAGVG